MWTRDPNILEPDEATTIWRYVSLGKFLSLLSTQSLWFARLGLFEDAFEGTLSKPSIERFVKRQKALKGAEALQFQTSLLGALNTISRRNIFANCWHANIGESDAFWRIYGSDAIAIQSTVGRLGKSLTSSDKHEVKIGRVSYVPDPEQAVVSIQKAESIQKIHSVVLTKRSVFEYENEVRAFAAIFPPLAEQEGDDPMSTANIEILADQILAEEVPPGHGFDVDLITLIERVYYSSNQPGWFGRSVEATMNRFGLGSIEVRRSSVGGRPEYWRNSTDLIANQALYKQNLAAQENAVAKGKSKRRN